MALVVGVLGSKGGSGKTTVSHALAHGLGSLPRYIRSVVVTTDERKSVPAGDRRYLVADGRTGDAFARLMDKLVEHERLVIVVDGAARRDAFDIRLAERCDLVLVPVMPSRDDVDEALADLARMQNAVAVPNRWPSRAATAERKAALLAMIPAERRMRSLPEIAKLGDLRDDDLYAHVATDVSSGCRAFALNVLGKAGIHPLQLAYEPS